MGLLIGAVIGQAEGVTGQITDDSQVTIAWDGANGFGATGPTTDLFDDFRGGAEDGLIPLTSPQVGTWAGRGPNGQDPLYTTEFARSGSSCMRGRNRPFYEVGDISYISQFRHTFTDSNEIFISYCLRTPQYWPGGSTENTFIGHESSDFKVTWLSEDGMTGNDTFTDICLPTKIGWVVASEQPIFQTSGNDGIINLDTDPPVRLSPNSGAWGDDVAGWYDFHAWTRFVFWLKPDPTDADGQPGTIYCQVTNPVTGGHEFVQSTGFPVFNGSNSNIVNTLWFPGFIHPTNTEDDCRPLYDDIYITIGDGAAARVEIGNNATYDSCTDLALATIDSWSNTSITCTIRSGAFSSMAGNYIHIHDSDNVYVGTSRIIG